MLVERSRPAEGTPRPRVLTRLTPEESTRYTGLVARVAPAVEDGLSAAVAANRLAGVREEPPGLRFVPWRSERTAFASRLAAMARSHPCLVFADVRDCYGSIRPAVVESALVALRADDAAAVEVRDFLVELGGRGVRGLPVGPSPSPVLANAVLSPIDRTLERCRIPHLRWVDDVVAGAADRRAGQRILTGLAVALERLGLELNESKSRIVLDPALELTVPVSVAGDAIRVG